MNLLQLHNLEKKTKLKTYRFNNSTSNQITKKIKLQATVLAVLRQIVVVQNRVMDLVL